MLLILLFTFLNQFQSDSSIEILDKNQYYIYVHKNNKLDSVYFKNDNDLNSLFIVNISGKNLIVNRSIGNLYEIYDSVYKTYPVNDLKFRNHSQVFILNDTLFRYGGYGHNQTNDTFQFFNFVTKSWNYLKTNVVKSEDAPFNSVTISLENKTYFVGGFNINFSDGLEKIPHQITVFDFNTRKFIKTHFKELNFLNNKVLGVTETSVYFFDEKNIYHLNLKNEYFEIFKKDEYLTRFTTSNPNRKIVNNIITSYDFIDNQINKIQLNKFLNSKNLIEKGSIKSKLEFAEFIKKLGVLFFICAIGFILRHIIIRNRIRVFKNKVIFKGRTLNLEKNERLIFEILIERREISGKKVLEIVYNDNLSVGHNERNKLKTIYKLNYKLKVLFKKTDDVVLQKKNDLDKREVIYFINQ